MKPRKWAGEGSDTVTSEPKKIAIIMGSRSDWDVMSRAGEVLLELEVPFEVSIVSAHRTPDRLFAFAEEAESRGIGVIIAGAGGAAHLPGMTAAKTLVPVIGVPVPSRHLQGMDSLLSIVQMPGGVPVATMAIGTAGAVNAALLAAAILAQQDPSLRDRLGAWRKRQHDQVLASQQELDRERGNDGCV
ncbi:MAG: 5-(carboxyamino)imidazole ribonucleotide mutase [Thermaerobacter sp.]|nr:5-(carboxyamino)imidazole ribonucleotide mutase [Thermaerobacter sp.]